MDNKNKIAYWHIAISILPVVITLATGFISVTNTIGLLTDKVSRMSEDLKTAATENKSQDSRLDRLETRMDALTQKAYPNARE